jgi:hypothetical protein
MYEFLSDTTVIKVIVEADKDIGILYAGGRLIISSSCKIYSQVFFRRIWKKILLQ